MHHFKTSTSHSTHPNRFNQGPLEPFSFRERQIGIQGLQFSNHTPHSVFDLAIVGGGITGAAIAREAALRGMRVILVEQGDFGSGTSSRSSKMAHGGLRYLENLELGLVFESLSERKNLFEMAPHLVRPLRFHIPIFEGGRVPPWKMELGLRLYDALSLFETPEGYKKYTSEEVSTRLPFLKTQGLLCGFEYTDGLMDDDRLVLEILRSAHHYGATCLSYVKALGVQWLEKSGSRDFIASSPEHDPEHDPEHGPGHGPGHGHRQGHSQHTHSPSHQSYLCLRVRDEKSSSEYSLWTRHIVCAAGPWTDQVGKVFFPPETQEAKMISGGRSILNPLACPTSHSMKEWKEILRPSKGVHISIDSKRWPLDRALVMAAEERILFALPRPDCVLLGTTETETEGPWGKAMEVEPEDLHYLLGVANQYFPKLGLKTSDILGGYAGVRPLVRSQKGRWDFFYWLFSRSSSSASSIPSAHATSREALILSLPKGVTFVTGGKYTTHRAMAQQTLHQVLKHFSLEERLRWHHMDPHFTTVLPINPLNTLESLRSLEERLEGERSRSRFQKERSEYWWGRSWSPGEIQSWFRRWGYEGLLWLDSYGRSLNSVQIGRSRSSGGSLLGPLGESSYWDLEVSHSVHNLMCMDLVDFYCRRTPLSLTQPDRGFSLMRKISDIFARELDWSSQEQAHQEKQLMDFISKH